MSQLSKNVFIRTQKQ